MRAGFPRLRGAPERGGSVVALAVALPLLLTFLCATVDLGRTVFLGIALNDAAYAAARAAAAQPDGTISTDELLAAARAGAPAVGGGGLDLAGSVFVGSEEARRVPQRVFDANAGSFEQRPVEARRRPITVQLSLRGRYLTPVGAAVAASRGDADARFELRASFSSEWDGTVESVGEVVTHDRT